MRNVLRLIKSVLAAILVIVACQPSHAQLLNKIKENVKNRAEDHVVNDAGNATDKAIDKAEHPGINKNDKKGTDSNEKKNSGNDSDNKNSDSPAASTSPSIKSYQNYDFVPGDTILFEDNFADDQDGEFPAHWKLTKGQAVVNNIDGQPAFLLTQGNYCQVYPRMKTASYLTDPFTIEFDYYANSGYGPGIAFAYKDKDGNDAEGYIEFSTSGEVSTFELANFSAQYPGYEESTFRKKWHHAALIYKNNQVKCYIDQFRVLVIPDLGIVPTSFGFAGIGDDENPIIFTNVRLAKGGQMNTIGKKFTDAKIVTHGITFDVDKADIKPESMGTLNMIVKIMNNNPDLKFEVDGHTDNTGQAAHNLSLSQQRADAVKAQLEKMGISASRLTTKGFGDTKPISDNNTTDGRANNRRVEFVKM